MAFSVTDNRVMADHEELWTALNEFFSGFGESDWNRKHGKHWVFADVPYHLAYFNRLIADAIQRGARTSEEDAITTLAELDAWNNEQLSRRPKGQTGAQSAAEMRDSQFVVRRAARENASDSPVWLPVLRARGWRTTRFALAYNYWHTWLHFTEAHLRRTGKLPKIAAPLMYRGLNFNMEVTAGALNRERAQNERFIWSLRLTGDGGGEWTSVIENGECHVLLGSSTKADVSIISDIATYIKASMFNMENPILALILRKYQISGIGKLNKLMQLFAPAREQVWTPMEQDTVKR